MNDNPVIIERADLEAIHFCWGSSMELVEYRAGSDILTAALAAPPVRVLASDETAVPTADVEALRDWADDVSPYPEDTKRARNKAIERIIACLPTPSTARDEALAVMTEDSPMHCVIAITAALDALPADLLRRLLAEKEA